jgi:ABC-type branched-subunit amino acid transport system permease subunit
MQDGLRFVPGFPPEYIGQARIGTLGILLAVLMLFRPQGLVGRYKL